MEIDYVKQVDFRLKPLSKAEFKRRYISDIRGIVDWNRMDKIKKIDIDILQNNHNILGNLLTDWTKENKAYFSPVGS